MYLKPGEYAKKILLGETCDACEFFRPTDNKLLCARCVKTFSVEKQFSCSYWKKASNDGFTVDEIEKMMAAIMSLEIEREESKNE